MDFDALKRDFLQYKATYIIVIVTTLIWLWQVISSGNQTTSAINVFHAGGLFGPAILEDPTQIWRLFTPMFVHIGWGHYAMNMITVLFIGRQVEGVFGWRSFTVIYLLSGIFGNAMIFFLTPNVLAAAGASTSIFGIFASVAGLAFFTGDMRLKQIGKMFAVLIIINLIYNTFNLSSVSIWGHIGGALGGAMLSVVFPPQYFKRAIPKSYFWFASIAFVVLLIIFVGLPFMRR